MLRFQPVQFDLVRLVLCLLLQPAGPGCELVLFLARLRARIERQLADWLHVVDHPAQLVQLLTDVVQLAGVRRQVVTVTLPRLATVLQTKILKRINQTVIRSALFSRRCTYFIFVCVRVYECITKSMRSIGSEFKDAFYVVVFAMERKKEKKREEEEEEEESKRLVFVSLLCLVLKQFSSDFFFFSLKRDMFSCI